MGVIQQVGDTKRFQMFGRAMPNGAFYDDFEGAALKGQWETLLGTFAVNAGSLRASAIASDGHNFCGNAEFTIDLSGWTNNLPATLAQRDYTVAPNIDPTGGDDELGMEVLTAGGGIGAHGLYPISTIPLGATCQVTCRAYSPSANVGVNVANLTTGDAVFAATTVEDTWQTLTRTVTVDGVFDGIYLSNQSVNAGDLAHYDRAWAEIESSIIVYNLGTPNVQVVAGITNPAAPTVTPAAILVRVTDALNYWRVRIAPNTAGTDTWIEEVVAGVATSRATADVDWTAGAATDEMRVIVNGTSITAQHRKSGATVWTTACTYGPMATGGYATDHGLAVFAEATDTYTYYEEVPL